MVLILHLGISFTANNCTLVYLVDVAGARTTTDMFHDLYDDNIADKLFRLIFSSLVVITLQVFVSH